MRRKSVSNYRVVKSFGSIPIPWVIHSVYEVERKGKTLIDPPACEVAPYAITREDFVADWNAYLNAFKEPVLVYDNDNSKYIGEEPPIMT